MVGRFFGTVMGLTVVLGLSACGGAPVASSTTITPAAVSAAARPAAAIPTLGASLKAAEFAAAIQIPGTVLIDVRTPQEFAEGHIKGAINIDVQAEDFKSKVLALPKDGVYAIYCRSGSRSYTALASFRVWGFAHAYHMDAGINEWKAAGQPVVTG